ncbi:filamentous haemagglutinin family protein [Hyphococcus sp. DH-69]|uniref:filamentous haemagglutinin family protein n=1 Tax=Hyphococcus formosus TaxID=3143534 RepID=UPI00398B99B3
MLSNAVKSSRRFSTKTLKLSSSILAFAAASVVVPVSASAETPFGTMVGMQAGRTIGANGQVSQWTGANRPIIGTEGDRHLMTIEQTEAKAVLDWEDFRLKTDEILEFQQASSDWIAVNRVHGDHAATVDGEIRALGSVYIFNDNGVLIGDDAQINTRQLVVGSGVSDVDVDGDTTTFVQSQKRADLQWKKFEVETDNILKFEQQSEDWLVFNRDLTEPTDVTNDTQRRNANAVIDGRIEATGTVVINDETGFNISEGAEIDAGRYFLTQGIADVVIADGDVTITQNRERAVISWSDMNLASDATFELKQSEADWIAVSRDLSGDVVNLGGTINANGSIVLIGREGLVIAGEINAQQVVASSLEIQDDAFNGFWNVSRGNGQGLLSFSRSANSQRVNPTFSNTWIYPESSSSPTRYDSERYFNLIQDLPTAFDENDPQRFSVTVTQSGVIEAGNKGKIMLFGSNVLNQGMLSVKDEGQIILAAGDNIYIDSDGGADLDVYVGAINNFDIHRNFINTRPYAPSFLQWDRVNFVYVATDSVVPAEWVDFVEAVTGIRYEAGDVMPAAVAQSMVESGVFDGRNIVGGLIGKYIADQQLQRAEEVGFVARNEGIINASQGGNVDFRGFNLEQMGAITMTSTANFRSDISFEAWMRDYKDYQNTSGPFVLGNGTVVFGEGSLTQITPDLNALDTIPLTEGAQSVGSIVLHAGRAHMERDSIINMPSGEISFYLDRDHNILDPIGSGRNSNNEDGSRFLMDSGATIDLSGWEITRSMESNQVTGTVYVAELKNSPVQKDGPLYRKEISVDRRFGTNIVDWENFDNETEVGLEQLLTEGGKFFLASGDDLIMKSGSVIDVSGGSITYEDGFVYTTMLRRLDGTVIDIREADPDEVYMGLADQWVDYDTKWGLQTTYYIPLVSSSRGQYEESYVEGSDAGSIKIFAPDSLLQGTFLGGVTVGEYQRNNMPVGGSFVLNEVTETEREYISSRVLITKIEDLLGDSFGLIDSLADQYGVLFGEEVEPDDLDYSDKFWRRDNTTLLSEALFDRSTMGSYQINQYHTLETPAPVETGYSALDGFYTAVESGVVLDLAQGASFDLNTTSSVNFLGSVLTEGGDVSIKGQGIIFGADSFIDTSAKWYTDYELYDEVTIAAEPRIDAGDISLTSFHGSWVNSADEVKFILPETMKITANGGGWLDRDGVLSGGTGGDITITNFMHVDDEVDFSAIHNATAYGLGGNGGFALETSGEIIIGDELPDDLGDRKVAQFLTPGFFENLAFSSVRFFSGGLTVVENTRLKATQETMQIAQATLEGAVPKAWTTPSGSDILDVTTTGYVQPGLRPAGQRNGVDLLLNVIGEEVKVDLTAFFPAISDAPGTVTGAIVEAGAHVEVNPGGSIVADVVGGTLLAPAGFISVGEALSGAKILAPGAVRITERLTDRTGRELLAGEVLDGGIISGNYRTGNLVVGEDVVFDVSGTSADLDIATFSDGSIIRRKQTISSNGGTLSFVGNSIDIDNAVLLAHAGGEGARGGTFDFTWSARGAGASIGPRASHLVNRLISGTWNLKEGYLSDDGRPYVYSLVGVDLSTVDFGDYSHIYAGINFDEETYLPDDLVAYAQTLDAWIDAAENAPTPMFFIGDVEIDRVMPAPPPLIDETFLPLFEANGFEMPTLAEVVPQTSLSPSNINAGGFSSVNIAASDGGIVFAGESVLGERVEGGSYSLFSVELSAKNFYSVEGASFTANAENILLTEIGGLRGQVLSDSNFDNDRYEAALVELGVSDTLEDTSFTLQAGTVLNSTGANFTGFENVNLFSDGDIRFAPTVFDTFEVPAGTIETARNLTLKADQTYVASGREMTLDAGHSIIVLAQDEDDAFSNASPLEGAAQLTLRATRITQGGVLRSPLGAISLEAYDDGSEGSDTIQLIPGSITSVSADGNVIPYGALRDGDTWVDPFSRLELSYLPDRNVTISADKVHLEDSAIVDVSGGGDLLAYEFVPGIGGSNDWLSGYRDQNYNWVADNSEIFAILPGYETDVTPIGTENGYTVENLGKIYLSGANGLPEGEYTLLPARYAILPGAYRVTAKHHYGEFADMPLGQSAPKPDGSVVQAGYRLITNGDGTVKYRDPRTAGYLVMPQATLGARSTYNVGLANTFFDSEGFLRNSLRSNTSNLGVPRTPNDGGGVVLLAGSELTLNGKVDVSPSDGKRSGYVDIAADRLVVTSEDTDSDAYANYLQLNAESLESLGANSLLLGGIRGQNENGATITTVSNDVILDTAGTTLSGKDMIFVASSNIEVKSGTTIEATGEMSDGTDRYEMIASAPLLIDDKGTSYTNDDEIIHGSLDFGAILHVSAGERAEFVRDAEAIEATRDLIANPSLLAEINTVRDALGLVLISADNGKISIEDGASLISERSIAIDGTADTSLAEGATISTEQLTAAASRISLGDVSGVSDGLVFSGSAANALATAADLSLKSYSSIDLYGGVGFHTTGDLTLDSREIHIIDSDGGETTIRAENLTIGNTTAGAAATATSGPSELVLEGGNITISGSDKAISGVSSVTLRTDGQLAGKGEGNLNTAGDLSVDAGVLTVNNGDRLGLIATGDIILAGQSEPVTGSANSLGATLQLKGASIRHAGHIVLNGGNVQMHATAGNVDIAESGVIDVSGTDISIFDHEIGISGGTVSLTSDDHDIVVADNAIINVSGGNNGGNAGFVELRVPNGNIQLDGEIRGDAANGQAGGSFSLIVERLSNLGELNEVLNNAGFDQKRSFEVSAGDVTIDDRINVHEFALLTNDGSILVDGTISTIGTNGGDIILAAAENINFTANGILDASAKAESGKGGTVSISTAGRNGGQTDMPAGVIDVSGNNAQGGKVHFRAPQVGGNDIAIGSIAGAINGARSIIAEAFRAYDNIATIDQAVIDTVTADADAFMTAAYANHVEARLGNATLVPGIDLRNNGDMELVTDWDLHNMRYGPDNVAGVLSLRAAGDLLINGNISDGFDSSEPNAQLIDGNSWTLNLVAGANIDSPLVNALLNYNGSTMDSGSIIIGGASDPLEIIRLDPNNYDMSQIIGDPNTTEDYYAGWIKLRSAFFYHFGKDMDNTDPEYAYFSDLWSRFRAGTITEEYAYNDFVAYLIANNPKFLADASYNDSFINLLANAYGSRADMSPADQAEFDRIMNDTLGGTYTYEEGFVQFAVFLYNNYPVVFKDSLGYVPQTEPTPAAPYYLRVNGVESALYNVNPDGTLGAELDRDFDTGYYIDPVTNMLIQYEAGENDYTDTSYYARSPLPWIVGARSGDYDDAVEHGQVYNPTGFLVRTGNGDINIHADNDLVLEQRPSVIYTAGSRAADIPFNNSLEPEMMFGENGGDININVGDDILANTDSPQTPVGWMRSLKERYSYPHRLGHWYVDYSQYQAGIGALGGGDISIVAGGDIRNLGVSSPTNGRISGDGSVAEPYTLTELGGGDVEVTAGGDILGGVFTVMKGDAKITASGSFKSSSHVEEYEYDIVDGDPIYPLNCEFGDRNCSVNISGKGALRKFDLYTMVYASDANIRIASGGDLDLEAVMDPLLSAVYTLDDDGRYDANKVAFFNSYSEDASVELFSAGGDLTVHNNHKNVEGANRFSILQPFHYEERSRDINTQEATYNNATGMIEYWPGIVSMVAAGGDISVLGGMKLAPSAIGTLEIIAGESVTIGQYDQVDLAAPRTKFDPEWYLHRFENNFRNIVTGITMGNWVYDLPILVGEPTDVGPFTPNLHDGDQTPSKIYAGNGDLNAMAGVSLPEALWVKAGENIYFPTFDIQHNHSSDLSLIKAGEGIYFSDYTPAESDGDYFAAKSHVTIAGPGRLEIESGGDLWIPDNSQGIVSRRSTLEDGVTVWAGHTETADIGISVGYNQLPNYMAFEDAYFNPETVNDMAEFLLAEVTDGEKLPIYLFDRFYARGSGAVTELVSEEMAGGFVNFIRTLQGLTELNSEADIQSYLSDAWDYWLTLPDSQVTPYDGLIPRLAAAQADEGNLKPEFFMPERREGLVNFVRSLQGLEALDSAEEQFAYLPDAIAFWNELPIEHKTSFYRDVLFLEMRTASREANDFENDRFGSANRGYDAIATLYPGAEKAADETLNDGDSRWKGDFETFASRIISEGGDVSVVVPGGFFRLASISATNAQTGQPSDEDQNGDALRSGIVTQNGGAVNILAHGDIDVNQSRILTTEGGNLMIWSSFGNIAAGNGAKTSLSPATYEYATDEIANLTRSPAGLPTGAGIGTLASTEGTPPADVDLVASYGLVDAGDAGVRVSGNFNVFAIEILGTDNIDVIGRSSGLPVPPAAPPTSLDVGDLGSKSLAAGDALDDAIKAVQNNNAVTSPSLIEVEVTGYDDEQCEDDAGNVDGCESSDNGNQPSPTENEDEEVSWSDEPMTFNIASNDLDIAVKDLGKISGYNILYDAGTVTAGQTSGVYGTMTMQDAFDQLLGDAFVAVPVDHKTIMIRKAQ